MAKQRFVVPNVVRLGLSDGDWIEIKERLDFGETQALTAATLAQDGNLAGGDAPTLRLDLGAYKVKRMLMYLLDWSFRDVDDKSVQVTEATIKALDPETAAEIDAALDAHIAGIAANPTAPTPMRPSP